MPCHPKKRCTGIREPLAQNEAGRYGRYDYCWPMTESARPRLLIEDWFPVAELGDEALYWYSRTSGAERGRVSRALRLLLADD